MRKNRALTFLLCLTFYGLNAQNNPILFLDTSASLTLRDGFSIIEKIDFQYEGTLVSYDYYYFLNKYLISTKITPGKTENTRDIFLYTPENHTMVRTNHQYVNRWVYNYYSFFVDNELKSLTDETDGLIKSLILLFSRTNYGTDFYKDQVITTYYGEFIELFDKKTYSKKFKSSRKSPVQRFISPVFIDSSTIACIKREPTGAVFSYTTPCKIIIYNTHTNKIQHEIPWNNLHHIRARGDYMLVFEIPDNYLALKRVYMQTYLFNWKDHSKTYLGLSLDATFR